MSQEPENRPVFDVCSFLVEYKKHLSDYVDDLNGLLERQHPGQKRVVQVEDLKVALVELDCLDEAEMLFGSGNEMRLNTVEFMEYIDLPLEQGTIYCVNDEGEMSIV